MTYRALITGSRTWDDRAAIYRELDALLAEHGSLVVVHGACSRGADAMAQAWVMDRWTFKFADVRHEAHPADWRRHKGAAGRRRNLAMIETGVDECLAFIAPCAKDGCRTPSSHGSHGATHCADAAEKAGIPTRRWTT